MELIQVNANDYDFNEKVEWFWKTWGSEDNRMFYEDCMRHSKKSDVPCFYIIKDADRIIGTVALLRNELVSRQDLTPWLACLYVDPDYRKKRLGFKMMNEVCKIAAEMGYRHVYLSTDLDGYYEKAGWTYVDVCYGLSGGKIKVYRSPELLQSV
ncbi:GNAT family N-acetyltransferase [Jeotgalibacillus salarius]|uniref:GNAT family N-acetyltransferase n=1 Tax=Jeotgalibacillus salarius TaxID=546023 RepID=A0A4Y8LKA0_9BACL|nr:GNAT family N-acetyltransferase [Jeotgalibacillus salarius]TFE02179.1 GNAT family N-acetyltransferase [Jeotgalibacillus salarius]